MQFSWNEASENAVQLPIEFSSKSLTTWKLAIAR